jgi:site-specific DNA-methyltransferase (adenine-specific)
VTYAQVGLAELYHGDVLEAHDWVTAHDSRDKVDLWVTSPPYRLGKQYGDGHDDTMPYLDYLEWSALWLGEIFAATSHGGRLCLNVPLDTAWGGERRPVGPDLLDIALSVGWKYHTTIVWNEGNVSRRTAWGSFMKASAPYVTAPVELIYVLFHGEAPSDWKRESDGRTSTIERQDFIDWTLGLWSFGGESAKRVGHPAPFPEELPKRLIQLYSFLEDRIGDPFLGSGTVCKVANDLGRRSIGLDVERDYLKLATIRLAKAQGQTVLFDSDGTPHIQAPLEEAA